MAKIVRNDVGEIVAKDVIAGHRENAQRRTSNPAAMFRIAMQPGGQVRSPDDRGGNSIGQGQGNGRNVPRRAIEDLSVGMIAVPAGADPSDTKIIITNRIVSPSQTNRFLRLRSNLFRGPLRSKAWSSRSSPARLHIRSLPSLGCSWKKRRVTM